MEESTEERLDLQAKFISDPYYMSSDIEEAPPELKVNETFTPT
jgi:hypothetical protein